MFAFVGGDCALLTMRYRIGTPKFAKRRFARSRLGEDLKRLICFGVTKMPRLGWMSMFSKSLSIYPEISREHARAKD